jgi:Zn-finger nucleic acid-binding protein
MRKPMNLKQCDVCGGSVILTQVGGVDRYMCMTCKAVYFDNGVRDMTFPSIYDQADHQASTFRQAHRALLRTQAPVPVTSMEAKRMLEFTSFKYDEVVQWRRTTHAAWAYGLVKGYDANQALFAVDTGNMTTLWLDRNQVRSSKQPLPVPVSAPPSQAKLSRTSTGKSKALAFTPKPVPLAWDKYIVWTWQVAGGRNTPIKTELSVDKTTHVALTDTVTGITTYNSFKHVFHLFDKRSGALLGTGTNMRKLVTSIRAELDKADKATVALQLDGALRVCNTQAVPVSYEVFFNRDFQQD